VTSSCSGTSTPYLFVGSVTSGLNLTENRQ
jgi:hypothetical protein